MHTEHIQEGIEPWLNAQRIGIAAYAVMGMPRLLQISAKYSHDNQKRKEFLEISGNLQLTLETSLQNHLNTDDTETGFAYTMESHHQKRFAELPPSVLHLLEAVLTRFPKHVSEYAQNMKDFVKSALAMLYETHAQWNANAQSIAYHIMDSTASARRVIRLGQSLWGGRRQLNPWVKLLENSDQLNQIEQLLDELRIPNADTSRSLFNIGRLTEILKDTPSWSHVQNTLISQVFAWPLLVPTYQHGDLAISLPVAIDVVFDGRGEVLSLEGSRAKMGNGGGVDASRWLGHLKRSVEAAKILWLSKHGNHGIYRGWRYTPDDFRWKVEHASVIFDFHWANCILGDIPASFRDGSADTCFAMVVLARLLGRRSYLSSVVTGLVGERSTDKNNEDEELDFWVKPPEGIVPKLKYFFASQTFERAALPKGSEEVVENALRGLAMKGANITRNAEVAYGAKLSHLADIVHVHGWRQDRFIRCPEIQWAISSEYHENRSGLLESDNPQVKHILDLLGDNNCAVLDLQEELDATPRVVASTLWHVNMRLRPQMHRIPPRFSSLFIRATPEQQDGRFWEVVWRAMGASIEEYRRLHCAPSPKHVAALLAEALNTFQPLETTPGCRAPDLIIVIGSERFLPTLETTATPTARSLAVMPVLNELILQSQLRISPNAEALAMFLGRTRIILLSDSGDEGLNGSATDETLEKLNPAERHSLSALSIFRYGFTHSMAGMLLNLTELPNHKGERRSTRDLLRGLLEKKLIRYGQGCYHLPFHLRTKLQATLQQERGLIEQYHLAAGTALAPYVLDEPTMALAFDRAFLPENIYEALFHFNQAFFLTSQGMPLSKQAGSALRRKTRLLRFAAFQTWSTMAALRQCINEASLMDAYEMGKELVASWEKDNTGASLHPEHYLNVARSALTWSKTANRVDIKTTLRKELEGPEGLLEKALKACDAPQFAAEREFNRPYVLSVYTNYLAQEGEGQRAQEFDQEILRSLHSSVNARGVQGEWFERVGDDTQKHSDAAQIYKLGLQWVPQWHQLWLKAIGAATCALQDTGWINPLLERYAAGQSFSSIESALVYIVRKSDDRWKSSPAMWVKERWNEGVKLIGELWRDSQEVQKALREIRKYN